MMVYKQCCVPKGGKESSCCPGGGSVRGAFTKTCGCMDLSKSTISHHFKELQNAGLITCEREGQTFRCRINEEAVDSIKKFFE